VSIWPVHYIINRTSEDLHFSQKGAPNRRFLAPGMAQSFHWTIGDMPHLLQLSFSSGLWGSSGAFKIDTVGDTVLQVRSVDPREDCQKYPPLPFFSSILSCDRLAQRVRANATDLCRPPTLECRCRYLRAEVQLFQAGVFLVYILDHTGALQYRLDNFTSLTVRISQASDSEPVGTRAELQTVAARERVLMYGLSGDGRSEETVPPMESKEFCWEDPSGSLKVRTFGAALPALPTHSLQARWLCGSCSFASPNSSTSSSLHPMRCHCPATCGNSNVLYQEVLVCTGWSMFASGAGTFAQAAKSQTQGEFR
jgi:hypothetical protein